MKVVIAEDLFAVEALGLHLTTLLLIGALDWGHRVIIDGPQADDGPLATWLHQHRPGIAQDIREALDLWAREESDPTRGGWPYAEVHLIDGPHSEWTPTGGAPPRLCIADLFAILRRPFEVHVEDDITDRAFLLAIAPGEIRDVLLRQEEAGALVFYHGGGTSKMRGRFERLLADHRGQGYLFRRRRMWTMFDSDIRPDGQGGWRRSNDVRTLRGAATRLLDDTGMWCLARRFIESYLPHAVLERHADEHGCLHVYEAWLALDEERRSCFNMKDGLTGDRRHARWASHHASAWNDCHDTALEHGFGESVATLYQTAGITHDDFDAAAREEARQHLATLMRRL